MLKIRFNVYALKTPSPQYLKFQRDNKHLDFKKFIDINYDIKQLELEKYGTTSQIIGFSNHFQNANQIYGIAEQLTPKYTVLGGMNKNSVNKLINTQYFSQPLRIITQEQEMLAQAAFTYLDRDINEYENHIVSEESEIYYIADKLYKVKHFDTNLTIGMRYLRFYYANAVFGLPDMTLLLEDIVLRMSLDELKEIFMKTTEAVIKENKMGNKIPYVERHFVYEQIKIMAKKKFPQLFQKLIIYQAAFFVQLIRIYKDVMLLADSDLMDHIYQVAKEPLIPMQHEVFRSYLKPKNKKLTRKEQDQIGLECIFSPEQKEQMRIDDAIVMRRYLQDNKFDFSKEKLLYDDVNNQNPDEILEKYAILNILIDDQNSNFIRYHINPFKDTIYNNIIKSKYSTHFDIYKYMQRRHIHYESQVNKVQTSVFENINLSSNQPQIGMLTKPDFTKYIDNFQKKLIQQPNKFLVMEITKSKQLQLAGIGILRQTLDIIERQKQLKINQNDEIISLVKYLNQENLTVRQSNIVNQLIVQANAELDYIIKLPHFYSRYIPYIQNVLKQSYLKKIQSMQEETDRIESTEDGKKLYIQKSKVIDYDGMKSEKNTIQFGDTDELPKEFHNMDLDQLKEAGCQQIDYHSYQLDSRERQEDFKVGEDLDQEKIKKSISQFDEATLDAIRSSKEK